MHSSQEDCHTENYCQGFIPRKHQREELAPEEDIDPKRQHTTLTFGEASLVRCWIFISFLYYGGVIAGTNQLRVLTVKDSFINVLE